MSAGQRSLLGQRRPSDLTFLIGYVKSLPDYVLWGYPAPLVGTPADAGISPRPVSLVGGPLVWYTYIYLNRSISFNLRRQKGCWLCRPFLSFIEHPWISLFPYFPSKSRTSGQQSNPWSLPGRGRLVSQVPSLQRLPSAPYTSKLPVKNH